MQYEHISRSSMFSSCHSFVICVVNFLYLRDDDNQLPTNDKLHVMSFPNKMYGCVCIVNIHGFLCLFQTFFYWKEWNEREEGKSILLLIHSRILFIFPVFYFKCTTAYNIIISIDTWCFTHTRTNTTESSVNHNSIAVYLSFAMLHFLLLFSPNQRCVQSMQRYSSFFFQQTFFAQNGDQWMLCCCVRFLFAPAKQIKYFE